MQWQFRNTISLLPMFCVISGNVIFILTNMHSFSKSRNLHPVKTCAHTVLIYVYGYICSYSLMPHGAGLACGMWQINYMNICLQRHIYLGAKCFSNYGTSVRIRMYIGYTPSTGLYINYMHYI